VAILLWAASNSSPSAVRAPYRSGLPGAIESARALASEGRWLEAEAAFRKILAECAGRLDEWEFRLQTDLESCVRERGAQAAIAQLQPLLNGDKWKDLKTKFEGVRSRYGDTRSWQARETEWVKTSNRLEREQQASAIREDAFRAASDQNWPIVEECLVVLKASYSDTAVCRVGEADIEALRGRMIRARRQKTDQHATRALDQAQREFAASQWARARDLFELVLKEYAGTTPVREKEAEIRQAIRRCESNRREETARIVWACANLAFRTKDWAGAGGHFDRLLGELRESALAQSRRGEIESRRDDCVRNLKSR
jgi:hypothetical protein